MNSPMTDESPGPPAPGEKDSVAARAGLVAFVTILSRILGYVRDAVLANLFGASDEYDSFIIAQTIPNFLRRLVAEGALVIAFIPLLAVEKTQGGLEAMRRFTAAVLGLLIPFLLIIVAIGILFPQIFVTAFAPGFEEQKQQLALRLTEVMMGYIFFISLMAVAGGALNVQGHFAAPAAAPILLNVANIACVLWFRDYFPSPIEAAAWGVLIGGVLQLALQLPYLKRAGLFVMPKWEPMHPSVVTLLRRLLPAIFGVAVYQINIMVIRQIGSFLPSGQLTYYYNATRLQEFALGVFAVSVSVAALPTISEHAAKADWNKVRDTFRRAIKVTNFVTIPATVALFVAAGPVVSVLFRHGKYTSVDAAVTAEILQILNVAIIPIGIVRILVPTFYALGDTRIPVVSATASLFVTLILGYALKDKFEIHGLCTATTVAAFAQVFILSWLYRRTLKRREQTAVAASDEAGGKSIVSHALLCLMASLPGAVLWQVLGGRYDFEGPRAQTALVLAFGLFVLGLLYAGFAKLFRIEEMTILQRAVLSRAKRLAGKR